MLKNWKGWYRPTLFNIVASIPLVVTTCAFVFFWIKDGHDSLAQAIWMVVSGASIVLLLIDLLLQRLLKNLWIVSALESALLIVIWVAILALQY